MLEHRDPLHALSRNSATRFEGDANADSSDRADFGLVPVVDRSLLLLQVHADETALNDSLTSQLGLRLPAPRELRARDEHILLWLAPGEWLLELPRQLAARSQSELLTQLVASLVAVTDVSDAFACLEMTGGSVDVLNTACSLDLRAESFAAGSVARTSIADVPAIIWRPDAGRRLRCLVDRSVAVYFWRWFIASPSRW